MYPYSLAQRTQKYFGAMTKTRPKRRNQKVKRLALGNRAYTAARGKRSSTQKSRRRFRELNKSQFAKFLSAVNMCLQLKPDHVEYMCPFWKLDGPGR